MTLAHWAIPNLTTEDLWARDTARRELRSMSPEELLAHADYLILRNAEQESILRNTVRRCQALELELMLHKVQKALPKAQLPDQPHVTNPKTEEHLEWSREVTQQLATLAQMRAAIEPPST